MATEWYDAAPMKPDRDTLTRFLFEHAAIRGEVVHLDATWQTVLEHHDYPPVLRLAMGELMAAAALLAATLKLKGSLVLQIQGKGPVTLLVVECTGELTMRATAKWTGELPQDGLAQLVGRIGNLTTFPEVSLHLPPIVNRNFPPVFPPGSSDLSWNPCRLP